MNSNAALGSNEEVTTPAPARARMPAMELRRRAERDPASVLAVVRQLADQGVAAAQLLLGRMFLQGAGVDRNEIASWLWFQRAAAQYDAEAINMVGRCLENGWGTEIDMEQAFRCYRQAAELGDAWAQYNLGHLYLDGNGTTRDVILARHWYASAAAKGHPRAMNLLARCYEEGWGIARDSTQAAHWYEKSAEGGYFRGQYNWATILVRMNRIEEAALWLSRAVTTATPAVREAILAFSKHIDHASMRAVVLSLDHVPGE